VLAIGNKAQNPGQSWWIASSVWDSGQELKIRDCPACSGTVGTMSQYCVHYGV